MRVRAAAVVLVAALTLGLGTSVAHGGEDPQPVRGAEESLGTPIPGKVLSPDAAQGVDSEGRPQAYWVTNGNSDVPAMFQVSDLRTGTVVFRERVPVGTVSWAVDFSAADGAVYFGMTEGRLYRWTPGDAHLTDLGIPLPGQQIWQITAAPDGTIYGGTYPGGRMFGYDPATRAVTDHGQIVPGETYGQALAADADHVYFGTQPHAKLARLDRRTGQVQQIPLPAEYAGQNGVYDMTLTGGLLFVRITDVGDLVVIDTATLQVVDTVRAISGRAISKLDPSGRYVYFRKLPEGIVQYDVQARTSTALRWAPNAIPGSWAFVDLADPAFPGTSIALTYYNGRIYVFNPQTRATRYYSETGMGLEPTPNPIQTLGAGPDGKVYVSGFLSPPGMAQVDPATGAATLLTGAGQIEGFGAFGNHLVMGRYPNGDLLDFDTTKPWAAGTNPDAGVTIGEDQNRPQVLVGFGDRIAVASVPKSGRLGGAVTLWDPGTGDRRVFRNVVPDQSVVSLVAHGDVLVGGTSINGGYGVDPVATEARLFVLDPATGQATSSLVPVPGAHTVNGLTHGPDGRIWGLADGALFVYDPASGTVTRRAQLFEVERSMYGSQNGLVFHEGYLYAVSSGSLWRVDPRSWGTTRLATGGVQHLTQDPAGNLYYGRVANLYRWNFAAPSGQEPCDVTVTGTRDAPLDVRSGLTCLRGATVHGPVSVGGTGRLIASDTTIAGSVRSDGSRGVTLVRSTVGGPLTVSGSSGAVRVVDSTVNGTASYTGNRGTVVLTGGRIAGPLSCTRNDPAPELPAPRPVTTGPATGQCATG